MMMELLKQATEECENPDLRDRAFIYWRLLATDPVLAKKIILAEKPPISDLSYSLETSLLDRLIENIGTLASVYQKVRESFVKKLRESQNLKELEEREDNLEADYADSTGQQAGAYAGEITTNEYEKGLKNNEIDLLGDSIEIKQNNVIPSTNTENSIDLVNILDMGSTNKSSSIRIPLSAVLTADTPSIEKKITGLVVEGAFQREGENTFLELKVSNKTGNTLGDFAVKFNKNPFKMQPVNPDLPIKIIDHFGTAEAKVPVNFQGQIEPEPPSFPFKIQVALKTNMDIFMFFIPCSLSVMMTTGSPATTQQYQEMTQKMSQTRATNSLNTSLDGEKIKEKFKNNNIYFVGSRKNEGGIEMMSFSANLINGMQIILDTILQNGVLQMSYGASHNSILPLLYQAVGFILNL